MSEEITLRISLPAALNYTVKLFFGFLDSKWENDELCSSASFAAAVSLKISFFVHNGVVFYVSRVHE